VAVDEAGHDEPVREIERRGARRRRRRGADRRDAASATTTSASRSGAAPVPSNRVPQRIARIVTRPSITARRSDSAPDLARGLGTA